MLCAEIPKACDILKCGEDDAQLWIGESALADVKVSLTNLATGRRTLYEPERLNQDVIIDLPDLLPGTVYLVQIVTLDIQPTAFSPYEWDGTQHTASVSTYTGIHVTMDVGFNATNGTYLSYDQWLSIC